MKYYCPLCGGEISESEYLQVCGCGCPSCRRTFDRTVFKKDITKPNKNNYDK